MLQKLPSKVGRTLYAGEADPEKENHDSHDSVFNKTFLIFYFVFFFSAIQIGRADGFSWVEGGTEAGVPCLDCPLSTSSSTTQKLQPIPVTQWPVGVNPKPCVINSIFNEERGIAGRRVHKAIDFECEKGDPIYPVGPGEVIAVNYRDDWGWYVSVRLTDGKVVLYSHLQKKISVKVGQKITTVVPGQSPKPGQITTASSIGTCGSTGRATGDHLHFELYPSDLATVAEREDPLPYLAKFLGQETCSLALNREKKSTHKKKRKAKGG